MFLRKLEYSHKIVDHNNGRVVHFFKLGDVSLAVVVDVSTDAMFLVQEINGSFQRTVSSGTVDTTRDHQTTEAQDFIQRCTQSIARNIF